MNIKDYWTLPPTDQNHLQRKAAPKPAYLRPRGCKCHMPDARACWAQKHGEIAMRYPYTLCQCSCHTDCGGEG